MKRALFILAAGLGLSLLFSVGAYYWSTSPQRAMLCSDQPELAWLKHEFQLNDSQFERVSTLHKAYLTQCARMCDRIAAANSLIRSNVLSRDAVTPELETLLADAAHLRVECQRQMIDHFFQVSREMPQEQGQRYLAWVQNQIFVMPHEQPEPTDLPSTHGDH